MGDYLTDFTNKKVLKGGQLKGKKNGAIPILNPQCCNSRGFSKSSRWRKKAAIVGRVIMCERIVANRGRYTTLSTTRKQK